MMRSVLLSMDKDTIIGLRLAGIEGRLVKKSDDLISIVDTLLKEKNVGIIMITQSLFKSHQNPLLERKLSEKEKIIIEIPGFNEKMKPSLISEHIEKSIGLKL